MKYKSKIMDEKGVERSIARITHEIIEKNHGVEDVCLIGIRTRGIPLAVKLGENIKKFEGISVPVGHIDITLYRDDLSEISGAPETGESSIPCDMNNKIVVIVDDVIYTGRTARAAIEAVFSYGRPKLIQLAVLVDRGHRELPIRPDFVGKNVPTSKSEMISVKTTDIDGESGVYLCEI